jgi:hypothetical protein
MRGGFAVAAQLGAPPSRSRVAPHPPLIYLAGKQRESHRKRANGSHWLSRMPASSGGALAPFIGIGHGHLANHCCAVTIIP